jgi:choline dehydrogenase-like flavoprotein
MAAHSVPPAPPAPFALPTPSRGYAPSARSSVAFAEAIVPGSPLLPAADERTVAAAEDLVRSLHPTLLPVWRFAHELLDKAAIGRTGRPFHKLPALQQDQLLRAWEGDAALGPPLGLVSLVYKLVHFDRAPDRKGANTLIKHVERPRWMAQVQPLDEAPSDSSDVECDVVVVGTGAGGAVVGRELAERGFAVVFVEEGDYKHRDEFDGGSVKALRQFHRPTFSVGNVAMPILVGRMVGGSTTINGGTCFRTPSWVLDDWCERLGTDAFSSSAMAPYFERVERILDVAPTPLKYAGPIAGVMARGCDRLGWSHFAINRNAPDCDGSGFCDFGCRREAKRSTQIAYLPAAFERGAVLFTGATVRRVLLEGAKAVGVEAESKTGRRVRVRARVVVLAGGALPTPLLLLQQGLANRSDQVGRNLALHPSTGVSALFEEPIEGHKYVPQGYAVDHFLREGILISAAQPAHNIAGAVLPYSGRRLMGILDRMDQVAGLGVMIRDSTPNGRVWTETAGLPLITYNVGRQDVERMHRAMTLAGRMCLEAGAKAVYPNIHGLAPIERPDDFKAFEQTVPRASDIVWLSYHPNGTCKMGRDAKTSVVGIDHETHDVHGLFVTDASTLPTAPGVNPQVSIMAMATRAAGCIAERLA